jgi:DNA helicase HerA-like ATPase
LNVKGRDLLGIDVPNAELSSADKEIYKMLELESEPFKNVKYFYPFSKDNYNNTYADKDIIDSQKERNKCWFYKYEYEHDKDKLDLLFSNIDDQSQTMDSIINYIRAEQGNFGKIKSWNDFNVELNSYGKAGNPNADKEIPVVSWRKFKRIIDKTLRNSMFAKDARGDDETRLQDAIQNIKQNDVFVVDIAKLDETLQGFVFGDVIRSVYDLKLGQAGREDEDIPKRIIVFIDELNKYASSDVPKNSPILSQLIDIAERGRSLGIVLFGAEQFRSVINDRIKGNCATQAYGRTNAIEVSKKDYQYVPAVYKSMMTRLDLTSKTG